jgi:hypothetical protein
MGLCIPEELGGSRGFSRPGPDIESPCGAKSDTDQSSLLSLRGSGAEVFVVPTVAPLVASNPKPETLLAEARGTDWVRRLNERDRRAIRSLAYNLDMIASAGLDCLEIIRAFHSFCRSGSIDGFALAFDTFFKANSGCGAIESYFSSIQAEIAIFQMQVEAGTRGTHELTHQLADVHFDLLLYAIPDCLDDLILVEFAVFGFGDVFEVLEGVVGLHFGIFEAGFHVFPVGFEFGVFLDDDFEVLVEMKHQLIGCPIVIGHDLLQVFQEADSAIHEQFEALFPGYRA